MKGKRMMWFVACYIEREKKRKQTRCQVSSRKSWLTLESEKKKKEITNDCYIDIEKKRKQTRQHL